MLHSQSFTTNTTGIAVMLTAYACLCTPAEKPIECYLDTNTPRYFASVSPLEFVTDVRTHKWLKFQDLVQRWRIERGATSSITEMVIVPAYQKIIGMGEDAIPLIVAQLKSEGDDPDQWFWALMAITEVNPVNREDQGDFVKMAQAWLKWAEAEGYAG